MQGGLRGAPPRETVPEEKQRSSPPGPVPFARSEARAAAGFHLDDIDRALDDMHESFDISREDLDLLLSRAEVHARERRQRR